jgi:hypothetical protein
LTEFGEAIGQNSIINPSSPPFFVEQTGFVHHFKMMANGGLRETQDFDQLASTDFTAGLSRNQAQQLQASRFAKYPEERSEIMGFGGGQATGKQRWAAERRNDFHNDGFAQTLREKVDNYVLAQLISLRF